MKKEYCCIIALCLKCYVVVAVVYVNEGSVDVLICPFKADEGEVNSWFGPPSLTKYSIGTQIDHRLSFHEKLRIIGDTDNREYNLQISNISQRDIGQYRCSGISNGITKDKVYDVMLSTVVYVNEGSVDVLICPFKADEGEVISWFGPPSLRKYSIGTTIDTSLSFHEKLRIIGDTDNGEYNLQISNITQRDIGQYRCMGIFNGIIKTKLYDVMLSVAPLDNPLISTDPSGYILAGQTIKLTCMITDGKPLAVITWECTGSGQAENLSNSSSAISTVQLDVNKKDNGKTCKCIGSHPLWTLQRTADITMDVKYVPDDNLSIQQSPAGGIVRHDKIRLTCTATGGNPLAVLTWDCSGTTTNETKGNVASYSVTFTVYKTDNNRICSCLATHVVTSYKPSVKHTLHVYYEPANIPKINQTPPGYIISNSNVVLTCEVSGGNPLAILSWNCTGALSNNTSVNTASYSVELNLNRTFNNKVCACLATHRVASYSPTVRHLLVVSYAPDKSPTIQQMPTGSIITGHEISLTCRVSGGNPLPTLSWNCTGAVVNNTTGNTASLSVSFTVDKTFNNKICTCVATHPVSSYRPSIQQKLIVIYEPDTNPVIQQTPSGSIITGIEIILTCTVSGGNPLATLTWNCSGANIKNTTGHKVSNSVTFTVDKTFNNKICTCSAIHHIVSYRPRVQRTLIVYFKPLLDTTRSNSPEKITTSKNDNLFITVSVNSNPHPIIKWTFIAQENNNVCNNSVLNSTSINVGLHSSSNISIDYLKKNQFGQYIFIATNVVGIFRRKFSVLEKASAGEDILTIKEGNSGMFIAGVASLVVGLLFFVTAIVVILRKRFKKTFTKSSKSDEYSDLQTSNPAFQDPYTSLQNTIESIHHQESSASTYEECGNASDAAAYQNIENMKYGHKKAEKKMGIYDNMKI